MTKSTKNEITVEQLSSQIGTLNNPTPKTLNKYIKSFGIFIGLYNKINNTRVSVEAGLNEEALVKLFNKTSKGLAKKGSTTSPKSTKRAAWEKFNTSNGTTLSYEIYTFLKSSGGSYSRADIAAKLKLRLSTVCGRVADLKNSQLIQVVGTDIDPTSQCKVELLKAI